MRKGIQRDLRRLTYLKNEIGQSSKLSAELFDHKKVCKWQTLAYYKMSIFRKSQVRNAFLVEAPFRSLFRVPL